MINLAQIINPKKTKKQVLTDEIRLKILFLNLFGVSLRKTSQLLKIKNHSAVQYVLTQFKLKRYKIQLDNTVFEWPQLQKICQKYSLNEITDMIYSGRIKLIR